MIGKRDIGSVGLVGHPYAPIGRGEDVRCAFRSLSNLMTGLSVVDIYGYNEPDEQAAKEFGPFSAGFGAATNIFFLNGNEVEQSLAHLSLDGKIPGYSIVYPAWELSGYPDAWARQLDRFDEIWAPSAFIRDALVGTCAKPVVHMPLACDVHLHGYLNRRYFGLPEQDYIFMFFYDLKSYASRKNPEAVVKAFRRLLDKRQYANVHLVMKINGGRENPDHLRVLLDAIGDISRRVTIIDRVMSDFEIKNLVRVADCFVSLHRSEGYGRGIAESMILGKPVIATAYSGNMDFMREDCSYPVNYSLVPVCEGEYPYAEGQHWADADVEHAALLMIRLVDDPQAGYRVGLRARLHMKKNFAFRPVGLRYLDRIEEIGARKREWK